MAIDRDLLQIVEDRKKLHQYPEPGWLEFQTTLRLLSRLRRLGWTLSCGKSIHHGERYGLPDEEKRSLWEEKVRALPEFPVLLEEAGLQDSQIDEIFQCYTGVVADYDTGRKGPLTALRFDIDALDLDEAEDDSHRPCREGFSSENAGFCHACGHDAHMSLGLYAAACITKDKRLNGRWRLIFQPAEESARGAHSMIKAGVLEGVDFFLSAHIGMGESAERVGIGTQGFLATGKYELFYHGLASHAGLSPEKGKNALLAAAALSLQLHTLPQYGSGMSRVNVGVLEAGRGSNIIPDTAKVCFEFRASDQAIQDDLRGRVTALCHAMAEAYGLKMELHLSGEAPALLVQHPELCARLAEKLEGAGFSVDLHPNFGASEDVTAMMNAVEEGGGTALHLLFGANLKASHHQAAFDFDDEDLLLAGRVLREILPLINQDV